MLIAGQSLYFETSAVCVFKFQTHKAYIVLISSYTKMAQCYQGFESEKPVYENCDEKRNSRIQSLIR